MKKLLLLLVCLFTFQAVVKANDDKPIKVAQLPQSAQQFIKSHFGNSKVAIAKMETDWLDKSYGIRYASMAGAVASLSNTVLSLSNRYRVGIAFKS